MIKSFKPQKEVDIFLIGVIARDIIEHNGIKRERYGGGAFYGSFVLKGLSVKFTVITKLSKEHEKALHRFEKIDIPYIVFFSDRSSGIHNIYEKDFDHRRCILIDTVPPFTLDELNPILKDKSAKTFFFSPLVAGEIDTQLIEVYGKRGRVAIDIQGFIRKGKPGEEIKIVKDEEVLKILPFITYLKLDDAELLLLTNNNSIEHGLSFVENFGVKETLCTTKNGVFLRYNKKTFFEPFTFKKIVGRTGRGDTCFSSYIGARMRFGPDDALKIAAKITSLKMEVDGPINPEVVKKIYGYKN